MNRVSLRPSIGNWNYRCKSHYFITNNRVIWADKFTQKQIASVQAKDNFDKQKYIANKNKQGSNSEQDSDSWFSKLWLVIKSFLRIKSHCS